MTFVSKLHYAGYMTTALVFVLGFALFYYQTSDAIGSLFAALCSALLVLGSFIIVTWVIASMRSQ